MPTTCENRPPSTVPASISDRADDPAQPVRSKGLIEDIPQNQITTDAGLQVRVGLDPDTVEDYYRVILAAKEWPFPPIVVFRDEHGVNRLVDGFHRYAASLRPCRIFRLPAIVHHGTRLDALRFALGANARHGLRRSRADVQKAISVALESFPGLSDRSIADMIGCHHATVANIRNRVDNLSTCPPQLPSVARTGKDGKIYRTFPKSPKTVRAAVQAAGPAEYKTLHTDAHGHVIPKAILPMWLEAENVAREAIRKIDDVRSFVKRGVGSGLIWAEVSNAIIGDLDASRYTLTCLKPYCLCPSCKGHRDCTRCKNRGWISEYLWKCTASRDEKKAVGCE